MCRFLADLLNPEGKHGYGILSLKTFLQHVLGENRINDTFVLNAVKCFEEHLLKYLL